MLFPCMFKKNNLIVKYILIFFLVGISVFYLYPNIKQKYYSITKRLRLIETKLATYDKNLVHDLENYQNTRKPNVAISEIKDNIIFDWKELEVPWDKSKFDKTKALTTWKGNLIVGLNGIEKGSASIYMYDKKKWTELAGGKKKLNLML